MSLSPELEITGREFLETVETALTSRLSAGTDACELGPNHVLVANPWTGPEAVLKYAEKRMTERFGDRLVPVRVDRCFWYEYEPQRPFRALSEALGVSPPEPIPELVRRLEASGRVAWLIVGHVEGLYYRPDGHSGAWDSVRAIVTAGMSRGLDVSDATRLGGIAEGMRLKSVRNELGMLVRYESRGLYVTLTGKAWAVRRLCLGTAPRSRKHLLKYSPGRPLASSARLATVRLRPVLDPNEFRALALAILEKLSSQTVALSDEDLQILMARTRGMYRCLREELEGRFDFMNVVQSDECEYTQSERVFPRDLVWYNISMSVREVLYRDLRVAGSWYEDDESIADSSTADSAVAGAWDRFRPVGVELIWDRFRSAKSRLELAGWSRLPETELRTIFEEALETAQDRNLIVATSVGEPSTGPRFVCMVKRA